MNILLLHNRYQQRGGEDVCVEAHQHLLQSRGHRVRLLEADNSTIRGNRGKVGAALDAFYSRASARRVAAEIAAFRPDVVHIHNTFPLLSPAVILACKQAQVPVVHTFHNYRLGCPGGLLFREGRICEACLGRSFAWRGVWHGCYRGSRLGTGVVALSSAAHRWLRTYARYVDLAVALTEFAKSKLARVGLRADRIAVIPNWVEPDPGVGSGDGGYFLFVGRLSAEKGLQTLLRAWQRIGSRARLLIAGTGPLAAYLRGISPANVVWLCQQNWPGVARLMQRAIAVIAPSECYETFNRAVIEAFATGTPVLASRLGSLEEIVQHEVTGLHFSPGDDRELADAAAWLAGHPAQRSEMRKAARLQYQARYSGERVLPLLLEAYSQAEKRSEQSWAELSQSIFNSGAIK